MVHTSVAGESTVPISRNHCGPRSRTAATFATVSTLFTKVGALPIALRRPDRAAGMVRMWAHLVETVTERRCDPREGWTTVEDLEQRGLLTEEVFGGSGHHTDVDLVGPSGRAERDDGGLEPLLLDVEPGLQRDRSQAASGLGGRSLSAMAPSW